MASNVDEQLEALAAHQWGLVTTAQAGARGIERAALASRAREGSLERVRHGVYHLAGTPTSDLDALYAAWLATEPETPAWERLANPSAIVADATAARIHRIGDLDPVPYSFVTSTRKQSRQPDVRLSQRHLDSQDVVLIDGLPTTSIERTLADLLVAPGSDESIVADAYRDAATGPFDLDTARLIELLSRHARRLGYEPKDGASVYRSLRAAAGIDQNQFHATLQNTNISAIIGQAVRDHLNDLLRDLDLPNVASRRARVALEEAVTTSLATTSLPQIDLTDAARSAIRAAIAESVPKISIQVPQFDFAALKTAPLKFDINFPKIDSEAFKMPTPRFPPIYVPNIDFTFPAPKPRTNRTRDPEAERLDGDAQEVDQSDKNELDQL